LTTHPAAQVEEARIGEAKAQIHALDRAYYPKFYFQSAVFGRGSGFATGAASSVGPKRLGLDRSNWAVGVTVTFPLFDIFGIRSRKAIESANETC